MLSTRIRVLLPAADRLPAPDRPRGDSRRRGSAGTCRHDQRRRFRRVLRLRADAGRSAADAGGLARHGAARGRVGHRVFEILDREPLLRSPRRRHAAAARRGGARSARRRRRLSGRYPMLHGHRSDGRGREHGRPGRQRPAPARRALVGLVPRLYDPIAGTVSGRRGRREANVDLGPAARAGRARLRRRLSLLDQRARQHRLRRARTRPTPRSRRCGPRAGAHDFIESLPDGYAHAGRGARPDALGRSAPASRDRTGADQRRPNPDPRRRHIERRREQGRRDPGARSQGSCEAARRSSSATGSRPSGSPTTSW